MKYRVCLSFVLCAAFISPDAGAENLIPAPSGGSDPLNALHKKAAAYARQFYEFNSLPFGLSLDVGSAKEENRKLITDFFSQEKSFEEFSGKHAFEVIDGYGEYGDIGMFAGIATAATAYEYMFLRDSGGSEVEVKAARERLIRAMESWHIYTDITGGKGGISRGIMRIKPENPDDPPIPGGIPEIIPLFDEKGNPLPTGKHAVWREDLTGKYPDWIWEDDTSKDQTDGFIFALGVLWDAVAEDPAIPQGLKDTLQEDAKKIAARLMEKVDYNGEMLDLVIIDADGRKVTFHDLNPRIFEGVVIPEDYEIKNGFNATLALHVIRTLYHVSGDEAIGKYCYEDLIIKRKFIADMNNSLDMMYIGTATNYSNLNMVNTALYSLLRYETDDGVFFELQDILEHKYYNPGKPRQPKGLKQSLFDFTYAAFKKGGTDSTATADGIETLTEFDDPPYFNPLVINCDEEELKNKKCVAIDGKTEIEIMNGLSHGNDPVSKVVLPKKLRSPSNYEWRSDPHEVNGGGGSRLNPGGDFLGAYWIGRTMKKTGDPRENRSPFLRPSFMPVETADEISVEQPVEVSEVFEESFIPDATEEKPDSPDDNGVFPEETKKSSSGCSMHSGTLPEFPLLFLIAVFIISASRFNSRSSRGSRI